jgi:hypothetical protein
MHRVITLATFALVGVGCQLLCRPGWDRCEKEDCRPVGACCPARPPEGAPGPARTRVIATASPPIHVSAPAPEIVIDTPPPVIRRAPATGWQQLAMQPGPQLAMQPGPQLAMQPGPQLLGGAPGVQVVRERTTFGIGSISLPFPRLFSVLEPLPPPAESRQFYPAGQLVALPSGPELAPAPSLAAPQSVLFYPAAPPAGQLVTMQVVAAPSPQIAAALPPPPALVAMPVAPAGPQLAAPPLAPQIAAAPPQPPAVAAPVSCATRTELRCVPVQTTVCGPASAAEPPPMPGAQ